MLSKIFLLLTLIAISSIAQGEQTPQLQISALKLVQLKTEYVIDDVLALIESFDKGINEQINNIQESITESVKSLTDRISSINEVRAEKMKNCSEFVSQKEILDAELTKLNNYIDWIQKRIESDQKQIIEIQERRCLTHEVYIKYLMDSKLLLRLIVFLRAAIEKYSFAQLQQVNDVLSKYMTKGLMSNQQALKLMFAELGIVEFKQLDTKQRTAEEIGTGHVDNDRQQVDVKSFGKTSRQSLEDYKTELIGICNTLEELINSQIQERQDNEIDLNDQIIRYLTLLDAEILQLQKQLLQQQEQQGGVLFQIEGKMHLIEWCDGEVEILTQEVKKIEELITSYTQDQTAYKEQLNTQLSIINEIKNIYLSNIHGVAEDFKGRTDDYIYTAKFEGSVKFDTRELNETYGDSVTEDSFNTHIEELTNKAFEQ